MEICPNPILLSSDIAARTKNIRIGQAAGAILVMISRSFNDSLTNLNS